MPMGRKQALRVLHKAALNWKVGLEHALEAQPPADEEEEGEWIRQRMEGVKADVIELDEALTVVERQI